MVHFECNYFLIKFVHVIEIFHLGQTWLMSMILYSLEQWTGTKCTQITFSSKYILLFLITIVTVISKVPTTNQLSIIRPSLVHLVNVNAETPKENWKGPLKFVGWILTTFSNLRHSVMFINSYQRTLYSLSLNLL